MMQMDGQSGVENDEEKKVKKKPRIRRENSGQAGAEVKRDRGRGQPRFFLS